MSAENSASEGRAALDRALSTLGLRAAVTCLPGTPMHQVLRTMHAERVGSMVVADAEERPLGIFTLHDLLRATAAGYDQADPVERWMTPRPFALSPDARLYEAALAMADRGFRHVLVVAAGRVVGVVSERDLMRVQRAGVQQFGDAIRRADDMDGLLQVAEGLRDLAGHALDRGPSAEQSTRLISTLNDLLTRRVVELVLAGSKAAAMPLCWIALGSEGRQEQTLATDQDNGIIFDDAAGNRDAVRAQLLPVAQHINESLDQCGIQLCPGGIMAGNPAWCLSLAEWQARFSDWVVQSDPQALLNASIFFDLRPLWGRTQLSDALWDHLIDIASGNGRFLYQMARNALDREPPLGLLRDFALDQEGAAKGTLDLKLNGTAMFVDAARIYALQAGIRVSNTATRLAGVARVRRWSDKELGGWLGAFYALQQLRLRVQHDHRRAGVALGNRVDPDTLNPLDRRILLESLRQARGMQKRLALDYRVLERGL